MKILKVLTLIIALSFLTIACGSGGGGGGGGEVSTPVEDPTTFDPSIYSGHYVGTIRYNIAGQGEYTVPVEFDVDNSGNLTSFIVNGVPIDVDEAEARLTSGSVIVEGGSIRGQGSYNDPDYGTVNIDFSGWFNVDDRQFSINYSYSGGITGTATISGEQGSNYYYQTQLLQGRWVFSFTIISTFTDTFYLTTIDGSLNDQGGYYIYGTDQFGSSVIATYWPSDGSYSLLNTGSIIDQYYTFYTDGSNILNNSCYYLIDKSDDSWSSCYSLYGSKTASYTGTSNSIASVSGSLASNDAIEAIEQLALDEATNELIDDSTANKYLILKSLSD